MHSTNIIPFNLNDMRRIRQLHFIGIGGAGMSGIAEVLLTLGYQITGSDLKTSGVTQRLSRLGATIFIGHRAEQIHDADAVVISSAVNNLNPEVQAARLARIPIVPRAEMLAELMRFRYGIAVAGTHGKTTTTSLVASILAEAELDPTFIIGGRLNSTGANARLGKGRYLVAEADESDASFLYLQPMLAVVTNIDADHMATYNNDFNRLRQTFVEFLHHLPFYGLAVLCLDDVEIRGILPQVTRQIRTYGIHPQADIRATDIRHVANHTYFNLHYSETNEPLAVVLNLPGQHNVLNALASFAVATELNISHATILKALAKFQGIARRFQITEGITPDGQQLLLIDDYAHHPQEIAATMAAARAGWPERRLIVVFQPHRYSRTRDCFADFVKILSQADILILTQVYPAGEEIINDANGLALSEAIRATEKTQPIFIEHLDELPLCLQQTVQDLDLVLIMGAGDIGALAAQLPTILFNTNKRAEQNG